MVSIIIVVPTLNQKRKVIMSNKKIFVLSNTDLSRIRGGKSGDYADQAYKGGVLVGNIIKFFVPVSGARALKWVLKH